MLYTSSLDKIDILYPKMYIVIVMRYRPRTLNIDGPLKGHVAWYPTLSPNAELLAKFKRDNDWDYYTHEFYKQYEELPKMREILERLIYGSAKQDICMMCKCTKFKHCHTKILTNIGMRDYGYDIKRI